MPLHTFTGLTCIDTVQGMDTTGSHSSPNGRRSIARKRAYGACAGSFDKLTLITLVIALAGFAGTAFAAAPLDCNAQVTPSATGSR